MCPLTRADYGEDYQMWYTDDPRPLTDRTNWKPEILNELLERVALCGELKMLPGNCVCRAGGFQTIGRDKNLGREGLVWGPGVVGIKDPGL